MLRIFRAAFAVALLAVGLSPLAAYAHGMDRVLAQDASAGPYRVTVSSQTVLTPGAARITVQVRMPTGDEVAGAVVRVWLAPPGQTAMRGPLEAAPGAPSPPVHYDAIIQTDAAGQWEAIIEVQGPAGQGTATIPIAVVESGTTLLVVLAIIGGLVVLALLAFAYRVVSERSSAA